MSESPYEVSATNSAQQSVPNNTVTGVLFDTILPGLTNAGGLTSISGQLKLPFSGFYIVQFSIGVTSSAAGPYNLYATINDGEEEYGNDGDNAASSARVDLCSILCRRFSAGDIIKFNVLQVTGDPINIGNSANNRSKLSIKKISD